MKTVNSPLWLVLLLSLSRLGQAPGADLWTSSRAQAQIHRWSTLFTAQDVRDRLSTEPGLKQAMDWCRKTAVTKVYLESFRDGYRAERAALEHAKQAFLAAGFEVSGCVTTTKVGKPSNRSKDTISCYTDLATQTNLQSIFEYAASLFDETMIDDFWFTDCTCPECDAARLSKVVRIGTHPYLVNSDSWEDYRCELMVRLSRDCVLDAARAVNPKARLIINNPQWYDNFHLRGYEVLRETADFDRIWVGTETRDYTDRHWGGTPQYEGYFIMRWLGKIGGAKCGGGWYDPLGTTEQTYVEQARQTVLAGAHESLLFCYGALQRDTGPRNVEALRSNIPELLQVAKQANRRQMVGVAAYKPANSSPGDEKYVFDYAGMLGLPLIPCHEFPASSPAAFFSVHALKDAALTDKLRAFIHAGKVVLVTDGLARALTNRLELALPNVRVLPVKGEPKSLLQLETDELEAIRSPCLRAFRTSFQAPVRVSLYLYKDGSSVIENFNDRDTTVTLNGKRVTVPARGWVYDWR